MTQPVHLSNRPSSQGSLVFITGAAGGLGKAFAVECAARGWDLFLTDLNPSALQTLADHLRSTYTVQVFTCACDLTDPEGRSALEQKIKETHLHIWALINVAGLDYEGCFLSCTINQIRTILRLNIEAALELTHMALSFRDPLAAFRVINVASLAAFYPMPIKATYAASKRFMLDFSLALREELRPLGATVTVLCPAGLPTTAECIQAIEAQGWLGQITTRNIGSVAVETVDAALRGSAIVIPGWINRALHLLGHIFPPELIARAVHARWENAHRFRRDNLITLPLTGD
jgi:hypothetical protein